MYLLHQTFWEAAVLPRLGDSGITRSVARFFEYKAAYIVNSVLILKQCDTECELDNSSTPMTISLLNWVSSETVQTGHMYTLWIPLQDGRDTSPFLKTKAACTHSEFFGNCFSAWYSFLRFFLFFDNFLCSGSFEKSWLRRWFTLHRVRQWWTYIVHFTIFTTSLAGNTSSVQ